MVDSILPMPETDQTRVEDELSMSRIVMASTLSSKRAIQLSEDSQRWTRKDFLNFSIEEIWKEMDEISKSRKATHEEFQKFQDDFFDRTDVTDRSIHLD